MRLLIDSDFLYGLSIEGNAHHIAAKKIFFRYRKDKPGFFVLNLVIQETATVISHKLGQQESLLFLKNFEKLPVNLICVDESLEGKAWEIFKKQIKKGTSFVDCANLAVAKKYKIDGILSFDEFYPKEVKIK